MRILSYIEVIATGKNSQLEIILFPKPKIDQICPNNKNEIIPFVSSLFFRFVRTAVDNSENKSIHMLIGNMKSSSTSRNDRKELEFPQ